MAGGQSSLGQDCPEPCMRRATEVDKSPASRPQPTDKSPASRPHHCLPALTTPVLSQGWADPSPVLPNRYAGSPYSAAQMAQLAGVMANMTARAARAAARWMPDEYLLWLSTDHFSEGS